METLLNLVSVILFLAFCFVAGIVLGELYSVHKRNKANKWITRNFPMPKLPKSGFGVGVEFNRGMSINPNSITYEVGLGDGVYMQETRHYHTFAGAKKDYEKFVNSVDEAFMLTNKDRIKKLQEQIK